MQLDNWAPLKCLHVCSEQKAVSLTKKLQFTTLTYIFNYSGQSCDVNFVVKLHAMVRLALCEDTIAAPPFLSF